MVATAARDHSCAHASARAATVLVAAAPASSQLAPDFRAALCHRGYDRRAAWDHNRNDKVSDRRCITEIVDRNDWIRIDLHPYDLDGFRAGETRPNRGASAMDD